MSEVIHGACLCGQVTFDVNEPEALGVCHCTRCQRWTGSGNSAVVIVEPKNFNVTGGKERLKLYREAKFADRHFCGNCGSGVYVDGGDKYYVGAGVLKDVKLEPAFHIQVAYKAPWDEIGGNAPQFPEYPS
jgi:hypothetical protein